MTTLKLGSNYAPWLIGVAVIAATAFALFGFTGFRTIIAMVVLFVIPPLLLLRKSGLDLDEKVFFSLFIGLGIFPLLVFSVNQVLPSFGVSVVVAIILVAAGAFFAPRFLQRVQEK